MWLGWAANGARQWVWLGTAEHGAGLGWSLG
jgi:hypothetical protein